MGGESHPRQHMHGFHAHCTHLLYGLLASFSPHPFLGTRVTGKDAVGFFEKSELSREILFKVWIMAWRKRKAESSRHGTVCDAVHLLFLCQVWEMSNHNKQGFLDRLAFHKAMDIIALAQLVGTPSYESVERAYRKCYMRSRMFVRIAICIS